LTSATVRLLPKQKAPRLEPNRKPFGSHSRRRHVRYTTTTTVL